MTLETYTDREKAFCEYWLGAYTRMWAELTHKRFNEHTLQKLIVYEVLTRQRRPVVVRLVGRLYKIRKEAAMIRVDRALRVPSTAPFLTVALNQDDNSFMEGLDEGDSN